MVGEAQLDTRALELIDSGAISETSVADLADSLRITPRHLRRIVKAKTGLSPSKIDRNRRLFHARVLLQRTKLSVVAVAFNCDFSSLRQFNDVFKLTYHMTPREMRNAFKSTENTKFSQTIKGSA